jgi:hypothetical protein
VGRILADRDEGVHAVEPVGNWNESRYVDFWDAPAQIGGWLRLGSRPNEGHAEMSVCLHLPDGTTACAFRRPDIVCNGLEADGQRWHVVDPWRTTTVRYDGTLHLLDDPWTLASGRAAFVGRPVVEASLDLECRTGGLKRTLGHDQDHIDRIFVPGQATGHYQHLSHVTGAVRVGNRTFRVDGRGGKDHSWGPRNWHAKVEFRWLIAAFDDQTGFMLTRSVSTSTSRRGGFCLVDGELHLVDGWDAEETFGAAPHHELRRVVVTVNTGAGEWTLSGEPRAWMPLRHRQSGDAGVQRTLRIVKSPTEWWCLDDRRGTGMCEYHDLLPDDPTPHR